MVDSLMDIFQVLFGNISLHFYCILPRDDMNMTEELQFINGMQSFSLADVNTGIKEYNSFMSLFSNLESNGVKAPDSHAYHLIRRRRRWMEEYRKELLEQFSEVKVEDGWSCAICLESSYKNVVQFKKCHAFHRKCITQWFGANKSCPVCRQ